MPANRLSRTRRPFNSLALSAAIACTLCAAALNATAADEQTPKTLGEITVTAEKRVENVQKVPESITTIDTEKLDIMKSGGDDIQFISARVPSLLVESSFGRTFPRFYIRGLGNTDFDLNTSQPVSLVYDDVVLENPILKGFPVFDIDQVEVLRGPQGTLFGNNTPAGVVKFDSKKPSQQPDGYFDLSYGTYGTTNVEAAFGGALSSDWSGRVSFLAQHRDDWVDNTNADPATRKQAEFGGYNEEALRLQLQYKPSDDFSALLNVHAMNLNGSAILFRGQLIQPGTDNFTPGFQRDQIALDGLNFQTVSEHGGSLRLTWDFSDMELVSITGYEHVTTLSHGDIDGLASYNPTTSNGAIVNYPFPDESADGLPFHQQITQEVHLASKASTSPLDWIVGAYYYNENISIDSFDYNTLAGNVLDGDVRQQQHDVSEALFGSVGYQLTDALKIKGGLRYAHDEKSYSVVRYISPLAACCGAGPLGPIYEDPTYSHASWDISAVYSLTHDTDLYARVATSFRAPSIQGRLLFSDTPSVAKAETVTSYETGIKSKLFDNRATVSFDIYDYEMKNQQLTAVGGASNSTQLVNAKKTVGRGAELDAQAYITDQLMVTAGGSYNYTKIEDPNLYIATCGSGCTVLDPTINGGALALVDGNPLPQAPKWIGNITARYSIPYGDGEFFVYTDWAYRSKVSFFLYQSAEFTGKPWVIGGLRAGYDWDGGKREVAFYGRNITNKKAILGGIDFENLTGYVNEPRIFGVQFRAEL